MVTADADDVVVVDGEFERVVVAAETGGTFVPSLLLSALLILRDPFEEADADAAPPPIFEQPSSSPECLCSQAFFSLWPPYVGGFGLLDFSLSTVADEDDDEVVVVAADDALAGVVFGLLHGGGGACSVLAAVVGVATAAAASSGNVSGVLEVVLVVVVVISVAIDDDAGTGAAMVNAGGGGVPACTFITVVVMVGGVCRWLATDNDEGLGSRLQLLLLLVILPAKEADSSP